MLRDSLLVFDKQVFKVVLELIFEGRSDNTIELFDTNSLMVGSITSKTGRKNYFIESTSLFFGTRSIFSSPRRCDITLINKHPLLFLAHCSISLEGALSWFNLGWGSK